MVLVTQAIAADPNKRVLLRSKSKLKLTRQRDGFI